MADVAGAAARAAAKKASAPKPSLPTKKPVSQGAAARSAAAFQDAFKAEAAKPGKTSSWSPPGATSSWSPKGASTRAKVAKVEARGGVGSDGGRAELKRQAFASAGKKIPTQPTPARSPVGKAFDASRAGAGRVGKGLIQNGKPAGTGPIIPIMMVVFAVVAVAKIRGAKDISTTRALFGGFMLTFILMALYKMNAMLGTGFAVLTLMMALLRYGPMVLPGLGAGEVGGERAIGGEYAGTSPEIEAARAKRVADAKSGKSQPGTLTDLQDNSSVLGSSY